MEWEKIQPIYVILNLVKDCKIPIKEAFTLWSCFLPQIPKYPSNGCSNSLALPQKPQNPRSQTDVLPCSRNFLLLGNEDTNNHLTDLFLFQTDQWSLCFKKGDHPTLLRARSWAYNKDTQDDVTDGRLSHWWIRNPKFRDRLTPSTATSPRYEFPSWTRFNSVWSVDLR